MSFDSFVIPFTSGLIILLVISFVQIIRWANYLSKEEKKMLRQGFFSKKLFLAIREFFWEGLIHRRIFKVNPVLGYMHFCFAFGWFMLIAIGNLESRIHAGTEINPPYYPIFFKFFVHDRSNIPFNAGFEFIMDFFLLLVLSGWLLAIIKRFHSGIFGMKKTTQRKILDKIGLTALWLIFPLRFLAESFTASTYHTGSFLTDGFGSLFSGYENISQLAYFCWWAYSSALCLFFICLPFTRYMHILAEGLLIALRQFGLKSLPVKNAFSLAEIQSCSRCGICIDVCQLNSSAGLKDIQPVYLIRSMREEQRAEYIVNNCMLCHRCRSFCPVGIETSNLRIQERNRAFLVDKKAFGYVSTKVEETAEIAYFAGCMTHLTPSIKKAMQTIFKEAGENVSFIDKNGGICCGRPQKIAGKIQEANELIAKNTELLQQSGAKTLVTSCPICYNVFKNDYKLNMEVLHHTEYIQKLIQQGKIKPVKQNLNAIYHDPCELGRENKLYEAPRAVLNNIVNLVHINNEKEKSLCCGGSLGNVVMTHEQREQIRKDVQQELCLPQTDVLVTACPLCKKTLAHNSKTKVMDIAEVVAS